MHVTRRTILTIGLLLVLVGVFVLIQGPQIFTPLAQTVGLVTQYETETAIIPATLVNIIPSNYTFLSENLKGGLQVKGSVQVVDAREIGFYVMNAGNFSLWRMSRPAEVVLDSPTTISYNFTLTPSADGTYYFIFDNHDTSSRVVIFSLYATGTAIALNPAVQYTGLEALTIGILMSALGLKTWKRTIVEKAEAAGWRCKFCRSENFGAETFCDKCGRSQK